MPYDNGGGQHSFWRDAASTLLTGGLGALTAVVVVGTITYFVTKKRAARAGAGQGG